jgi:hypothetical protein
LYKRGNKKKGTKKQEAIIYTTTFSTSTCIIAIMPFEEHSTSISDVIALMKKRLGGFETEQGRLKGLSYVPHNENEVVITTTPKAGTTWMQQVRYDMD